jgi:molybdenum cofactor biosynthesis enzyme MoaA
MNNSEIKLKKPKKLARVELDSLDNLWFQVGGTICNLECNHCFISCSPYNDKFKMMTLSEIMPFLEEAKQMGVKEFYFTGGEPFLNDEIFEILKGTLEIGPVSVLTNGTIITPRKAKKLAELFTNSIYSLEIRLSIDGFDEVSNDAIRGEGSFKRALKGIKNLVDVGMLPIITAMMSWSEDEHIQVLDSFVEMLKDLGYKNPRMKILPALELGAYEKNSPDEIQKDYVTENMMDGFDRSQLLCSNSRIVTDKGVYVCPILVDFPDAMMGETLNETDKKYPLRHPICTTCYYSGAICSNFSTSGKSER